MMNNIPTLAKTYSFASDFRPAAGSMYVCGRSDEERAIHVNTWRASVSNVTLLDVVREDVDAIAVRGAGDNETTVSLRSRRQLQEFWESIPGADIYLDITGLKHATWAGLLRGLDGSARKVSAVYVEPMDYRMHPTPTENEIYDLSARIQGVKPLPGFAQLRRVTPTEWFVPLLGFEGTRLLHLINDLQPPGQKICPVVGVPGFRCEYPFVTFLANRKALRDTTAWRKVRFAAADCPFELMNVLRELHLQHPADMMTVAPIGTKPHALGAILFALRNPQAIEIVYDHPVPRGSRTSGTSKLHVFEIGSFLG